VVDGVVIKHYDTHGLGREKARQYLDKIFQVEIQISPSEQQMKEFLDKQVSALDESTGGYWKHKLREDHRRALESGIRELARHNPRETKRLLNSALLRGRAAADNPDLRQGQDESVLFAQGVQLFLIQRIVHNWLSNGRNLLREDKALGWFERWSVVAQQFPEFEPPARESKDDAATAQKGRPESEAERAYEDLKKVRLTGDDLKVVDKVLLLEDNLLWHLLRIPFSTEVAQFAPKLEKLRPPPGLPEPATAQVRALPAENLMVTLPSIIRDRIGKELRKPVDQLASTDLSEVKALNLSSSEISVADLVHIAKLTGLQKLILDGRPVTDGGLAQLVKLTGLQTLSLIGTQVTDAGLAHLVKLTGLQYLYLSETKVTDAGLAHLVKLTGLQDLSLDRTHVTDAGLAHLVKLTGLQTLYLSGPQITDAGLAHLVKLTGLQTLWLDGTHVTDAGLAQLVKLTGLQHLSLRGTQITDAGLAQLVKLTGLQTLWLNRTQITDAGLAQLVKLTGLQDLSLRGTQITDAGLAHLVKLTGLQVLSLNGTQITDAGLAHLGDLINLTMLILPDGMSKEAVATLKKKLPKADIF
jgi:hypothetical protein